MSGFDNTAANAVLKELYYGQPVPDEVYRDRPFLAMIKKMEQAVGEWIPLPLKYADTPSRSSTFSNAQTNNAAGTTKYKKFLVTLTKDYSTPTIQNQTLEAMATDKGAFIRGVQAVVDPAINAVSNSLSSALFRSGTGSISSITTISTGVITLADPNDIVQFGVGQVLQASATDGAAPRTAKGYVISRSVSAGTITVAASAGGIAATPSSWTNGDYLLTDGDSNAKVKGLAAWIPKTDPTSGDSFFGIDRSDDPARLAGQRPQGTASQTIEEALIDSSLLIAREGGQPSHCIINFASWGALEKSLLGKVQYVDAKGPGNINFRGIRLFGANSEIQVFPDKDCPAKTAYMLQMDTWTLFSTGKAPKVLTYLDNNEFLRVNNDDAAEVRVGYYAQLGCNAPGFNAVIPLIA